MPKLYAMNEKKFSARSAEKEKKQGFFQKHAKLSSVLCGMVTGLINGLFGGGGGMVVVPMLDKLLKFPAKQAHATAILIILPISVASGLFYLAFGNLDWGLTLPVTAGVVVGGIFGALLLKKLSSKWITLIFSLVMAAAGVKMMIF